MEKNQTSNRTQQGQQTVQDVFVKEKIMPHCVRIDELSVRCDDIGLDLLVGKDLDFVVTGILEFFSLKALEDAVHICARRQSCFSLLLLYPLRIPRFPLLSLSISLFSLCNRTMINANDIEKLKTAGVCMMEVVRGVKGRLTQIKGLSEQKVEKLKAISKKTQRYASVRDVACDGERTW